MELVADANPVISALIKGGKSAEILLNFSFDLFAPMFMFDEIEKHKDEILRRTHRDESEFYEILNKIKEIITFYPPEYFEDFLKEAEKICPDEKDVEYFALALKLKYGIWSNDKKLREQNKVRIYSTEDLAREFAL